MQKNKVLFLIIIINILFGASSISSAYGKSTLSCVKLPIHLSGTLIQPDITTEWTLEQWKSEFRFMKNTCITQIIIQSTAHSGTKKTYYPTKLNGYSQIPNVDILDKIFTAAQTEDVDVYLGLQENKQEWEAKFANDRDWLNQEATQSNDIAKEIQARYGQYPGFKSHFKGWYLWFEFENLHFPPPPSKSFENMSSYYQAVGDYLHKLTPKGDVIIAPFYNVYSDPTPNATTPSDYLKAAAKDWKKILVSILANSPIDIIALQDGTGAKEANKNPHAATTQLSIMFKATQEAIAESNKPIKLWADTETYVENLPGMNVGLKPGMDKERKPMTIGKMVDNMNAVKPYVSNYISFSFNHYLSPQQYHIAFYNAYRNYIQKGSVETTLPVAPISLKSVFVNSEGVKLSWSPGAADTELAGYKIYRNNELIRLLFVSNPNDETSFSDIDNPADNPLSPDNYIYYVRAFDAAGNDSPKSADLSVTIPETLNNSAYRKSYTVSLSANPSHPDPGCKDAKQLICSNGLLTDGIPDPFDNSFDYRQWQGRNTELTYFFIIDLESNQTINEINSDWLQVEKDYIFLPKQITYSVSTDNITFEVVGNINKPLVNNANQFYRYRKTQIDKIGRYVKIEVKPDKSWSFVAEAQVLSDFN